MALERSRAEWRAAAEAVNAEARRQHAEIDAFEADYRRGVQDAVAAYCSMVLEASRYPKSFPQQLKLAYVPGSRQAVVEYELPTVAVVPAVKAYRYVKTSDTVAETPRPQAQIKTLYASVVAQVAIRTVHELLAADPGGHIDTVVFNGVVDTTDPGSGRRMRPCLVTVRTTRDAFGELDLAHVEPLACLKRLSAGVSKSPSELADIAASPRVTMQVLPGVAPPTRPSSSSPTTLPMPSTWSAGLPTPTQKPLRPSPPGSIPCGESATGCRNRWH